MSQNTQESNGGLGNTCKKLRTNEIDSTRGITTPVSPGSEATLANGTLPPAQESSRVIETFKQLNVHYNSVVEEEGVAVVPPSPKKRKAQQSAQNDESSERIDGVSLGEDEREQPGDEGTSSGGVEVKEPSLAEVLVRFGNIELNKDFYDFIKKTESRCELDHDVRESDRKAYSTAMSHVRRVIQEAVHAACREELPKELVDICDTSTIYQVLRVVSMSHEVIRFLVEMGWASSASYDGDSDLSDSKAAKSFGKPMSQNINVKENISCSSADEGLSPIKTSEFQHHGKHPRQQRRDSSLVHPSQPKESPRASDVASLISNDNPKRQRKNEDEACSLFAAEGYSETRDSSREQGASNHVPDRHIKSSHGADESEKASLSVSECDAASSKLYGPILSSLKWTLNDAHGKRTQVPGSAPSEDQLVEFERVLSAFPATIEESKELADKIYDLTDSVYKDFDIKILPGTRIALVASAFESVIKAQLKDDPSPEISV